MAIPALATADKLFICSYVIGADIDHRKALGIINEITAFTSEYIDGFCWIPVRSPQETNDHSWWWDEPDKDVVYVKVGIRVSADGYLHAWLLSSQKASELILWNNAYNTTNSPTTSSTTLHWAIEKMYRLAIGNVTDFVKNNIKFQKYGLAATTRLYMFGSYSNSFTDPVAYSIDHPTNVQKSSLSWYPNNSTTVIGDWIYSPLILPSVDCNASSMPTTLEDVSVAMALLDDGGSFTNYTSAFNSHYANDCPLMPLAPVAGDAFYFGGSYKFYEMKLNIGQAGVGSVSLEWSYWDGAWTQFWPSDGTNSFKNAGTNTIDLNMSSDDVDDWGLKSVDGSSQYWIRAVLTGSNPYTTQPILTQGWLRRPVYWVDFADNFDKGTTPEFWKRVDDVPHSESIISICHPSDPPVPLFKNWVACHVYGTGGGIGTGNNSGRSYTMAEYGFCTACDNINCPCEAEKWMRMNCEPNRAYVWIPAHCSDPAYDNQTDCENAGKTWIPGAYACDPGFTYDSYVSYTLDEWHSVTPSEIDYSLGKAKFPGYTIGQQFLSRYYEADLLDRFSEYNGDLDELKHCNFTVLTAGMQTNSLRTIYTKHVGLAILANADLTRDNADWTIVWQIPVHSTSDTTNVVTSPDASEQTSLDTLLNEIKGDYNAHRVSTVFHEIADNTNVVTSGDASGSASAVTLANEIKGDYNAHRTQSGVHYVDDAGNTVTSADATDTTTAIILANEIKMDYNSHLYTSNGYEYFSDWKNPDGLGLRTPGTPNTPYVRPIAHHDYFKIVTDEPVLGGFLWEFTGSDAFLSRDPGVQDLVNDPQSFGTHFNHSHSFTGSDAFLSRDPGVQVLVDDPQYFNTAFAFYYVPATGSGFEGRSIDVQKFYAAPVSFNDHFDFLWRLVNPLGDCYAISGSKVYTGDSYTVLSATEQDTIRSYEDGDWRNLVIAGDVDSFGNVVPEVGSGLRVWKDGGWKSVPRIGDPVGDGVIGTASTIIFEGDILGLQARLIEPQATGSIP